MGKHSWMVYAVFFCALIAFNLWLGDQSSEFVYCLYALWPLTFIAGWGMVRNYRDYFKQRDIDMFSQHQAALAISPREKELEAAKGVHPETYKLLLGERDRVWRFIAGTKSPTGRPYAVLYADPDVTDSFVSYFLQMSTQENCMSKRDTSDKDFSFDPRGTVSARVMYDKFVHVLYQETKCTTPFLDAPPLWLVGWGPETVAADLGWGLPDKTVSAVPRTETRKQYLERMYQKGGNSATEEEGAEMLVRAAEKTAQGWDPGTLEVINPKEMLKR